MKLKKSILIGCSLILASFLSPLFAQNSLEAWIKKCETTKDVDVTVISRKDPTTKKDEMKTVKVTFKENQALLSSLKEAFSQDKKDAYQVSEKKVNGEITPDFCRFFNAASKTETKFMFNFKGNQITVTMQQILDFDLNSLGG